MKRDNEKEWYYGNADKERLGPYSFDEVSLKYSFIRYFLISFKLQFYPLRLLISFVYVRILNNSVIMCALNLYTVLQE